MSHQSSPAVGAVERELPHLTEAWHKARKNYALLSGLLLAWELIGISITASTSLLGLAIKLLDPGAIPFAMAALILYLGVRATIEWHQCDPGRRETIPSIFDWYLSHTLAIVALLIFVVQRLVEIRFFDLLADRSFIAAVGAVITGAAITSIPFALRSGIRPRSWLQPAGVVSVAALGVLFTYWTSRQAGLGGVVLWGYMAAPPLLLLVSVVVLLTLLRERRATPAAQHLETADEE